VRRGALEKYCTRWAKKAGFSGFRQAVDFDRKGSVRPFLCDVAPRTGIELPGQLDLSIQETFSD
jgi:hypothetical protein